MMEKRIRHNRTHPHSEEKNIHNTAVTAIVVVLSVGLIALIVYFSPLGSLIQEHIIEPIASVIQIHHEDEAIVDALKSQDAQQTAAPTEQAAHEEPIRKNVLTVTETPFYILQMGTYLDEKSANEHALQLRTMGAGGVVLHDETIFRVFAAAYRDEESLIQVQSQVRADGFEATPYITEHDSVNITFEGEERAVEQAKSAAEFLSTIPNDLSDLCISFDRNQIDSDTVFEKLENMSDQANEILKTFSDVNNNTLQPILSIVQKYANSISTFSEEHDTISSTDLSGALKRLQIETILDYIRFFDQK